jgi:hypothetical protein
MKKLFVIAGFVAVAFGAPNSVWANGYKSMVLAGAASLSSPIKVPDDRFLVIRNFTQQGGTNRGTVSVTIGSQMTTVLTASILPADNSSAIEPINSIVIAGPATVNVTCGSDATTCFVSYRKESE